MIYINFGAWHYIMLNRQGDNDEMEHEDKIIDLSTLTGEEYKDVLKYIEFVKSKRGM